MSNPEQNPKPKSPEETKRIFEQTRNTLNEIFHRGEQGDIEATRAFNEKFPAGDDAAQDAYMRAWDANDSLEEGTSIDDLKEALQTLDSAIALDNRPEYRETRRRVQERLNELEKKPGIE